MKKSKFLFITIASMLLFVFSFSAPIMAKPDPEKKVTICHVPPGQVNEEGRPLGNIMVISEKAFAMHSSYHHIDAFGWSTVRMQRPQDRNKCLPIN